MLGTTGSDESTKRKKPINKTPLYCTSAVRNQTQYDMHEPPPQQTQNLNHQPSSKLGLDGIPQTPGIERASPAPINTFFPRMPHNPPAVFPVQRLREIPSLTFLQLAAVYPRNGQIINIILTVIRPLAARQPILQIPIFPLDIFVITHEIPGAGFIFPVEYRAFDGKLRRVVVAGRVGKILAEVCYGASHWPKVRVHVGACGRVFAD